MSVVWTRFIHDLFGALYGFDEFSSLSSAHIFIWIILCISYFSIHHSPSSINFQPLISRRIHSVHIAFTVLWNTLTWLFGWLFAFCLPVLEIDANQFAQLVAWKRSTVLALYHRWLLSIFGIYLWPIFQMSILCIWLCLLQFQIKNDNAKWRETHEWNTELHKFINS